MDILVPELLMTLLMISISFSIILMAIIQKIKSLVIFTKSWQVWLLDFILAFLLGIPFSIFFYNLSYNEAIWVSVFGFVGAPGIYEALKNQNIITYKPKSVSKNTIEINKANEIKRGDLN